MADAIGQQAAQGTRDGGADEEIADAQGQLVLGVEKGQVDAQAGEQAGLDDAQQQPTGDEGAVGVHQSREGGDDAPCRDDEGDPPAGGEELQHEVGGHLEEEVCDEEDGHGDLELLGREVEVLLESVEPGVANVDSELSAP